MELIKRFLKTGKQSFFLLGPRGTGKTTFLKNVFPEALSVDLLLPETYRTYVARPERLRELIDAHRDRKVIVLDEVQKAPQLLEVVHSLLEEKRGTQFVLSGSSARKLKKTGTDLLSGRALMRRMHPFIAGELGPRFHLDDALQKGLIPVIVDSEDPYSSLHAYIDLYIREEVQMEGLTRNIGSFSRFLEAVSFSHGAILNVSNISRECQVERKVVEGYITILEDLLLSFRIPVFTKRAKRAVSSHPKFYFFDAGIYNSLRPSGPLDRPEEKTGAALEGLVAQHLRAWIDYQHQDCGLFFWRTSSGTEIDFILYGSKIFSAIEVKHSSSVQSRDLRPLKIFGLDYPEAKRILVYRGKERLLRDGILIIPCEEFLRGLE